MSIKEIIDHLDRIASADNFSERSAEIVDSWSYSGVGLEVVEPVLRFMEENAEIDFGAPGPLVHFLERFYKNGYEEKLLESLKRKPTSMTVWMLNRILNGTKGSSERNRFVGALEEARFNPAANSSVVERIDHFLSRL